MSRGLRFVFGALAAVLLLVAGCGVPVDSHPRKLPASINKDFAPSASIPGAGSSATSRTTLYFITSDHLVSVQRTVAVTPSAEAVFQLLLSGPSESEQGKQNITTAIPAAVRLLKAARAPNSTTMLEVNLSTEMGTVGGNSAKAAYAQMVLTADALGFSEVRFQIDGQPVEAPTDDGNQLIVTADNFKPPLNPA